MDIFEMLNVENGDIEELRTKYQKLLYIYNLGIIINQNDEEICNVYSLKEKELRKIGEEFFKDFRLEKLRIEECTDIFSKVYGCLDTENINDEQYNKLKILMKSLPDCGMKYYLLARMEMKFFSDYPNSITINSANNILYNLNKAVELDPGNLLYQEYINLLTEAVQNFNQREKERLEEINREIAKRNQQKEYEEINRKFGDMMSCCIPTICCCFCCSSCCPIC